MERSRRIWLRLARYVVEKEQDIKQAMKFLEQCQGLVKIEDILPFFPGGNTNKVFVNWLQCNQVWQFKDKLAEGSSRLKIWTLSFHRYLMVYYWWSGLVKELRQSRAVINIFLIFFAKFQNVVIRTQLKYKIDRNLRQNCTQLISKATDDENGEDRFDLLLKK